MDATALNSKLELDDVTVASMHKALENGKEIVFVTGRNICAVKPYSDLFPEMKYAVTGSGATIYDLNKNENIYSDCMDPEVVKWIISAASGLDVLPIFFIGDQAFCPDWAPARASEFGVGAYAGLYDKQFTKVDDVFQYFMENPVPVEKLSLMFTFPEDKEMVYSKIMMYPLTFTSNDELGMEINASGVRKEKGLAKVCEIMGIELSECVAIGDSESDLGMIKAAGFGIAVGNAGEKVKSKSDTVVPGNDESGVAVAIEKYLL